MKLTSKTIVAVFLAFGFGWILASDRLLNMLVSDQPTRDSIQSVKGLAFVLLSAALIYLLVRNAETTQDALEQKTARERDRLAHILHVNPGVVYSMHRDHTTGKFVADFIGNNVQRVTGHPHESWFEDPDFWRSHIHPEDLRRVEAAQEELFLDGSLSHEYRLLHADGTYRWINDNLLLLRNDLDEPEQIIGSWLDVTDRHLAQEAKAHSESRYQVLFDINPLPMWVFDMETLRFLAVNVAAQEQYGYSRQEFLSMKILDIRPAEDVLNLAMTVDAARKGNSGLSHSGEWRHRKKDGTVFWVDITANSLMYGDRKARLILAQDITDRRKLEEHQRLIARLFDSSQEGIFITNAQSKFISVNPAFVSITGYDMADLAGETPAVLRSGRHDRDFYRQMWEQIQQSGRWEGEIWNRRKTGDIFPEWLTISAIKDAQGIVGQYVGMFTDTSSRKAAEERILYLANYDVLTGLPNRSLLADRAKVAIASANRHNTKLAVMHLNVDRFKTLNETFGQDAGDQVLAELARRLTGSLKPDDTVSRLGADNFVILLPNTTIENVAQIALRIMESVSGPFSVQSQEIRLTASIGIAEYPDNGSGLEQLSQAAEYAMQQAKRAGRNTFQFYSMEMQDKVKLTLSLENELKFAIARHELVLHYQPQLDVATNALVGAEALVRWQHPQRGMIAPGLFIPIAEESGLIREIGNWVMVEALRQNAAWRDAGLAVVPVAINLSTVQFKHPRLRETVAAAIAASGLPPSLVELELTESIAMEDSRYTEATINDLKSLGLTLSIDDFGTGYSSLSYLKRFAVDKLKIDQSFVRGLHVDPNDEAIVTTVINLAKSMGFRTIAEGVETAAQLDFLKSNGCNEYQGYLYSRPVPPEEFARFLSPAQG